MEFYCRMLVALGLPPVIVNWVISFLTDRSQMCKIGNVISLIAAINRSIIQGSGLGPLLYSIMEGDLHPISIIKLMFKYADDTNFIVPENTDVCLLEEFDHIKEWARKIIISMLKIKEIVFRHPNPQLCIMPPPLMKLIRLQKLSYLE